MWEQKQVQACVHVRTQAGSTQAGTKQAGR